MGRDWGREFESMFQQHGRGQGGWDGHGGHGGHGDRRGGEWSGPWGSWQWGPPNRRSGPPPWLVGLFGLTQQARGRAPRVRRGDVRVAILAVLADEPLNGYQVIQQISDRTSGAWRPSPGSVYPTIAQLEDEGLLEGDDERGRRTLRLSEAGREYLRDHADEIDEVWAPFTRDREERSEHDAAGAEGGPDFALLKPELGRVMNAVWQIITTGTDEQRRAAVGVLVDARRALYQILADHPGDLDAADDGGDHAVDDLGDGPDRRDREEEW
ncbi:MAG TPA: PadR family transcriptional regulator [Nocardioides sp.]|nr:PadR family transcriptional regulator [Nocardioides sp.]